MKSDGKFIEHQPGFCFGRSDLNDINFRYHYHAIRQFHSRRFLQFIFTSVAK